MNNAIHNIACAISMHIRSFSRSFAIAVITGLVTLTVSSNVFGQISADYYVDANNGSDSNSGVDFDHAFLTLQKAISEADSGDIIFVADGTYFPDEGTGQSNNVRTSTFSIPEAVSVYGGFHGADGGVGTGEDFLDERDVLGNAPAILHGDINGDNSLNGNAYHVVTIGSEQNRCRVDGFTITGGYADDFNGAHNSGAGMKVASLADIVNCTFTGNLAGKFVAPIDHNPGRGGAIFSQAASPLFGPLRIYNCTFTNNEAAAGLDSSDGGGAVFAGQNITVHFMNCLFAGNECTSFVFGDPPHTFCGAGGALNVTGDGFAMVNCTIADNLVEENDENSSGGGIHYGGDMTDSSDVYNSILWGNSVGTNANQIAVDTATLNVTYSDVEGGLTGTGNINQDPDFITGYRLDATSPCIDEGDNTEVLADALDVDDDSVTIESTPDRDLEVRLSKCIVDMGAFEYQNTCPADFDGDGAVDFDDFTQLLAEFGSVCPCETDLDCDGDVDFDDFTNLLANFGDCPTGLGMLEAFQSAGLDEDDYDDYLDIMENGTQQQKDCWTEWVDHYLNCGPECPGSEPNCDDPFLTN